MSNPSPLEINDLRLRLRALARGAFDFEKLSAALEEVFQLGAAAGPLIPDLIAMLEAGVCVPSNLLTPIITKLKSERLLKAAVEQQNGRWTANTYERCDLLKAGFMQFQKDLLDELYDLHDKDDRAERSAIVEALAVSGTAAAVEVLRVIEYRTAARIPELAAELDSGDEVQVVVAQLQRGENLKTKKQFLDLVRDAIRKINERPDPEHLGNDAKPASVHSSPGAADSIEDLLRQGESDILEFKAAFRWCAKTGKVDPRLQYGVVRAIVALANMGGGTLLIGVDNDGTVVGLSGDYGLLKGDRDGFERSLMQAVKTKCCPVFAANCLKVTFDQPDGQEVCRVDIRPSQKAVFLTWDQDEEFWVRIGNSTQKLQGSKLAEYLGSRFQK